jgi:hypothetical protein
MISFIKVVNVHYPPSLNGIVASDKLYNRYNSSVPYNPSVSLHAISLDEFKEFCKVDLQLAHRTAITHFIVCKRVGEIALSKTDQFERK